MNVSTTLPPHIVTALAPAAAAVQAEVTDAATAVMYATLARAAKVTVRANGNEYRKGVVAIVGTGFPDRVQSFAEDLYGHPINPSTLDHEEDDDGCDCDECRGVDPCEEHCSWCGCCTECDSRHGGDWDTLTGPNGDERCTSCDHWCNDR